MSQGSAGGRPCRRKWASAPSSRLDARASCGAVRAQTSSKGYHSNEKNVKSPTRFRARKKERKRLKNELVLPAVLESAIRLGPPSCKRGFTRCSASAHWIYSAAKSSAATYCSRSE